LAARNAGHAPQTCAHLQLAVERRSRGRKGEIPQPRHPGVALSQTRGRRGAERFRARQSTLRQSPHPAPAPVGRHGSLYGCRHSPAERKRAWGCPIVKTRRSAQPGLPEWHAERGSACRCERPALRAGERNTAACTNVRWQPPPAAGSLTERRWQPPAGRAGLCAVATACLQGRLCADLMRRLLAGALQRELATAGREGQLVCRGNRRPGRPACVPISCTACWQAPYRERVAAAGREGRLVCRSHAPPVALRWQREPHPGGPGLETVPDGGSDQPSHPVEPTESLSAGVRREPRQQSCMGRGPPAQAGRGPPAELERGPPP
jgi:hypothetical protein